MQNKLLLGNGDPVKDLQYGLGISREQKNKQLCGGDEVSTDSHRAWYMSQCPDCSFLSLHVVSHCFSPADEMITNSLASMLNTLSFHFIICFVQCVKIYKFHRGAFQLRLNLRDAHSAQIFPFFFFKLYYKNK